MTEYKGFRLLQGNHTWGVEHQDTKTRWFLTLGDALEWIDLYRKTR